MSVTDIHNELAATVGGQLYHRAEYSRAAVQAGGNSPITVTGVSVHSFTRSGRVPFRLPSNFDVATSVYLMKAT